MNRLKVFGLACVQLIKQAWQLPQSIATAFRARQQALVLDEREAERLDRLRNPSKYLGR